MPKRRHKHARRARRQEEAPVANLVIVSPESQFVPVPTRPVFGPRFDPPMTSEMAPGLLPVDVPPQAMPGPPPEELPPKQARVGALSVASRQQAAKNADLNSSLQILK
jgi:hypothetical protein